MRWLVVLVVCLVPAGAGEALAQTARAAVNLTATPRDGLVDSPVEIRASGLPPGRLVTLQASTKDVQGKPWRSRLTYGGGKDEIIDSGPATKELADFAHAHGRTNVTGKIYPNAGHGVGCRIPNLPAPTELEVSPGTFVALGGTSAANSEAAAATWAARLRFIASVGN